MHLNKMGKQIYEEFLLLVVTTKITGMRSEPVHLGPIYSLIMNSSLLPLSSFTTKQTESKNKTKKPTTTKENSSWVFYQKPE